SSCKNVIFPRPKSGSAVSPAGVGAPPPLACESLTSGRPTVDWTGPLSAGGVKVAPLSAGAPAVTCELAAVPDDCQGASNMSTHPEEENEIQPSEANAVGAERPELSAG